MTTPPGWYPDPTSAAPTLRWWDGTAWSSHLAPVPSADPTTPDGVPLAGWWQRVGASLLDTLFMLPLTIGVQVPVYLSMSDEIGHWSDEATQSRTAVANPFDLYGQLWQEMLVAFALGIVVVTLYEGIFLRRGGATPGKRIVGLRVRPLDHDGPLGWSAILRRIGVEYVVFGILSVVYLSLLDSLWPLWDKRRQTLHDKAAGTVVVQVVKASGR